MMELREHRVGPPKSSSTPPQYLQNCGQESRVVWSATFQRSSKLSDVRRQICTGITNRPWGRVKRKQRLQRMHRIKIVIYKFIMFGSAWPPVSELKYVHQAWVKWQTQHTCTSFQAYESLAIDLRKWEKLQIYHPDRQVTYHVHVPSTI